MTRGPDNVDPIWLESLVSGLTSKEQDSPKGSDKVDKLEEKLINAFNHYFPTGSNQAKNEHSQQGSSQAQEEYPGLNPTFGYKEPQNPVIPLTSSEEDYLDESEIPIVYGTGSRDYFNQDYFPQTQGQIPQPQSLPQGNSGALNKAYVHVPAIKFDHPQPSYHHPAGIPGAGPIKPAPGLQPAYGGKPVAEDGFIPMFYPDQFDPVRGNSGASPAFPGIDATLKLPAEGYTFPSGVYQYQPQPALNFNVQQRPPQPENEQQLDQVNPNPNAPGPIYPAVPYHESQVPQLQVSGENPDKVRTNPLFGLRGTDSPLKRPTKVPPTTPPRPEYEYEYEELPTYKSPESVENFLSEMGVVTTTEREVPTLLVEEVHPSKTPIQAFNEAAVEVRKEPTP